MKTTLEKKSLLLGLTAMVGVPGVAAAGGPVQKPNVLIILADDLGWGDLGYHGSVIRTPNIDSLAKQGIELDRFYSAPISSPARAGVLTGRYPSRFGFRSAVIPPWREYGLDETEQTLADLLAANGYANRAAIGKWHLGHTHRVHYPLNRGFNHFYGCLNGAIEYFTHYRDGELDWHRDWESSYDEGYSTDLIAREAVACIDRYAGNKDPFFLYVAFNAPHAPYEAPQDAIDRVVDRETFAKATKKEKTGYIYRAMVERMDSGIGEIVAQLRRKGQLDNTLILFMSDNGGVAGMTGGSTSLPLRGHKFQEWDGGVRVPAVVYWKEGLLNGRKSGEIASFVDIVPTIAQIVGAAPPPRPYDGVSMLSAWKGSRVRTVRDIYLGCGAVVNQDWKLILPGHNEKMAITEPYLVRYADDPYEKRNVAARYPDVVERLRAVATCYDTIKPCVEELPYGYGKEGFVSPKEWRVVKD